MTKMPVPIVHLDIHCSEPGYYVAADNEAQGRIIAELAIARGAHHIVVVGRAAFMQLTLRVLGIHKALALHPRYQDRSHRRWRMEYRCRRLRHRCPKSPSAPRTNAPILSSA